MNNAAPHATPPVQLLTPQQAAEALQMSVSTVYNHLRSGELPGRKIGGQWRVPRHRLFEPPKASPGAAGRAAPQKAAA